MTKTALVGLLLIGAGDAAIAQTTSSRPPRIGSAGQTGRGAPARQISIRAELETNYDSNVYGVSDEQLRVRGVTDGRSKGDFSISPSIAFDVLLPLGRQSVYARGSLGYEFYTRNSQLNRERINLGLGGNVQLFNRCSSAVDGSYQRQRSNAGDIFAVTDIPIARRPNTEEVKSIGVETQCGGLAGISPSFGYRHTETRNSTDLFKFNDSNQDVFDGSIGYQRPTLGRISIYGTYSKAEYLNRNILGLPNTIPGIPQDGVTSYSAGGRFERNIGSRIFGSASLGYTWTNPKSLFSRKFRGSSYAVNVTVIPTTRLSLDLIATRSADLSNSAISSFSVTNVYGLNGTYKLNERLSANFGVSRQTRDFQVPVASIDQRETLIRDKFTRAYGGFVYDLNRRIRLNGLVSQQRRGADNPLFRFNNTTVSLGASLALSR